MKVTIGPMAKRTSDEIIEFQEIVKTYSPESLLFKGKELAENLEYLKAAVVFKELQTRDNLRELASLYRSVSEVGIYNQFKKQMASLKEFNGVEIPHDNIKQFASNLMLKCMLDSMGDHASKEIPKEELFNLEKLIDRILLRETEMKENKEFEDMYKIFKDYTTGVFLNENSK